MSPCAHDSANQLIRENNQQAGSTYTWVYDNAGNIQSKNQYAYTTGTVGTASDTVNYSYDESQWRDLLTAYDGAAITYDQIGNPLSDGTRSYTWKQGHQLATLSDGASTWTNTYNADGLRTKRTNGTSTYSYVYNGSQLVQMTVDGNTLYFTYDASGTPQTVTYNGTTYFYATNLQGDITAILNASGETVVSYTYDAWGNHTSGNNGTGTLASTLGRHNPLRYRGYVYDTETGLYYLQSRYYNPELGRFVNADGLVATGQDVSGNNMFAYCGNNPENYLDASGHFGVSITNWASSFSAATLFYSFQSGLYSSMAATLADIGLYLTSVLLPKVAAVFWSQPWLIAGIVASVVTVVLASVAAYTYAQINRINQQNLDKTVEEILKTKKGSIKNAPLPPGGPNWNDLLKMTLRRINEFAQKNIPGFKEIYKLLTDGRFNR